VQQLLIGLTLGLRRAHRVRRDRVRGELIGLQMGLNFAGFFDPMTAAKPPPSAASSASSIGWLFIVINGHLLLISAVVQSFQALPGRPEPFAFLRAVQPQDWGARSSAWACGSRCRWWRCCCSSTWCWASSRAWRSR
jgi:flagellar biosynthetic protein FliR